MALKCAAWSNFFCQDFDNNPCLGKNLAYCSQCDIFYILCATEWLSICSISADEILREIHPLQENSTGIYIGTRIDGIEIKTMTPEYDIVSSIDDQNTFP
jgi:hypothetical protein